MDGLPEYIYPARLAGQGRRLRGLMRLTNMVRLAEWIETRAGSVAVEAAFFDTEKGLHRAHGEVSGTLTVRCQRCLEPMELPVRSELKLQFVEEASQIEGSSAKVSRARPDARSRGVSHETYHVDRRVTNEHATKQMGGAVTFAELPEPEDDYEIVPMKRGPLSLLEVIEDELILALPIAPMHPEGRCGATVTIDSSKSPLREESELLHRH